MAATTSCPPSGCGQGQIRNEPAAISLTASRPHAPPPLHARTPPPPPPRSPATLITCPHCARCPLPSLLPESTPTPRYPQPPSSLSFTAPDAPLPSLFPESTPPPPAPPTPAIPNHLHHLSFLRRDAPPHPPESLPPSSIRSSAFPAMSLGFSIFS